MAVNNLKYFSSISFQGLKNVSKQEHYFLFNSSSHVESSQDIKLNYQSNSFFISHRNDIFIFLISLQVIEHVISRVTKVNAESLERLFQVAIMLGKATEDIDKLTTKNMVTYKTLSALVTGNRLT